jgi:hypothetical protein
MRELRPLDLSRNRARPLEHAVADEFFRAAVAQAHALKLLSDEHFTVDGTRENEFVVGCCKADYPKHGMADAW